MAPLCETISQVNWIGWLQ